VFNWTRKQNKPTLFKVTEPRLGVPGTVQNSSRPVRGSGSLGVLKLKINARSCRRRVFARQAVLTGSSCRSRVLAYHQAVLTGARSCRSRELASGAVETGVDASGTPSIRELSSGAVGAGARSCRSQVLASHAAQM
jgi:hypothetical protein